MPPINGHGMNDLDLRSTKGTLEKEILLHEVIQIKKDLAIKEIDLEIKKIQRRNEKMLQLKLKKELQNLGILYESSEED